MEKLFVDNQKAHIKSAGKKFYEKIVKTFNFQYWKNQIKLLNRNEANLSNGTFFITFHLF